MPYPDEKYEDIDATNEVAIPIDQKCDTDKDKAEDVLTYKDFVRRDKIEVALCSILTGGAISTVAYALSMGISLSNKHVFNFAAGQLNSLIATLATNDTIQVTVGEVLEITTALGNGEDGENLAMASATAIVTGASLIGIGFFALARSYWNAPKPAVQQTANENTPLNFSRV